MIEFNQIKQFICIAEKGTISKAAETLHISQPALSRSMQKLESDLCVQLFIHYKNKILLSKTGEHFLQHAKKICNQYDTMITDTQEFERSLQTIKIASCTLSPLWKLTPLLANLFHSSNIETEIIENDDYLPYILNHKANIVITPFPLKHDSIDSILFLQENLFLSVPENHVLASKKQIHFSDLDGETMLLYSNIGFWRSIHKTKTPNTRYLIQDERSTFNEIVKSTSLLSYTSDLAMNREGFITNRVIIPIKEKEAHVDYYLSFLKSARNTYKDMIQQLKSQTKKGQ